MFNFDLFTKMNQDVIAAMTASSNVAQESIKQIATEATDYSKKSYEASTAVAEKLSGVKSVETAVEIQNDFAKTAYEAFVAQSTKMGELYTNMAKEAYAPFEAAVAKAKA
jgi:hypothetical protein